MGGTPERPRFINTPIGLVPVGDGAREEIQAMTAPRPPATGAGNGSGYSGAGTFYNEITPGQTTRFTQEAQSDPTSEYIAKAIAAGTGFVDESGNVQVYDAASDRVITFVAGPDGQYRMQAGSDKSRLSADAASAARLRFDEENAKANRDFEAQQALATRTATASENAKTRALTEQSMDEGRRQFEATFARDEFTSDRQYEFEMEKFAQQFAQEALVNSTRFSLEAESLAAQVAQADRLAGVQEEKDKREVYRNPSDFLYRAFESRGETSPLPRVTHGALLDNISSNAAEARAAGAAAVARAREAATRFSAAPATFAPRPVTPPPVVPPVALPSATAPAATDRGLFSALTPEQRAQVPEFARQGQVPKAEDGGHFEENAVMTGDSSDGKPNEELVIDLPNDGGLMVIPKDRLVGRRKRMAKSAPRMENGGVLQTIPGVDAVPPGVRDVMAGQRPAPYRFAAPNLTPRRLEMLTPGETDALSTTLAYGSNASLEDETAQLARLFGPVASRPDSRFAGGGRF